MTEQPTGILGAGVHEDYTWLEGDTEFEALFSEEPGENQESSDN